MNIEQEKFIKELILENTRVSYEWSTGRKYDDEIEKEYRETAQKAEELFGFKMPENSNLLSEELKFIREKNNGC